MKEPINIKAHQMETSSSGLNLGDIYYIFFRHKWKIVLVFITGLLGAAGFYFSRPPVYESETKILIHYIVEGRSPAMAGKEEQIITPDADGQNILNSEVEILTSFDLVREVAEAVGPEKILARLTDGDGRMQAAAVINDGLQVEAPRRGNIIRIVFRHRDPKIVQAVLSQLVDTYVKRHDVIHRGTAVRDAFFVRQVDLLRDRIGRTEGDLKKLKTDAQVISLDVSKQAYTEAITAISEQLRVAATELAERRATLNELSHTSPAQAGDTNGSPTVPSAVSDHYRRIVSDLGERQKQLAYERSRYKDGHFLVHNLAQLVVDLEAQKLAAEKAHPGLTRLSPAVAATDTSPAPVDLAGELRRVGAIEARIRVLKEQMAQVQADATRVLEAEPAIGELTRKKLADEASLFSYSQSLERAHIEEVLGAGKITNISLIQSPTPPIRNTKALQKPLMMLLAFACLGGLAWAFAVEKVLNQTVKRGADLERLLPVPLFLSVPNLNGKSGLRLPWFSHKSNGSVHRSGVGAVSKEVAPWDPEHQLRPYYEGLRDRLITYFEVRNMNHKPKLIAVTGCNAGAGVTTMASGLAAALSETGDGNVLFVNMNVEQGAAHPFFQGKPCALSDALELATRSEALVQENLYLVSARETNDQKLPRVLPRRFASLVPKMKASDYDYIIFDMPPITQTSVTARLSGFMDMVLLVVESEKTVQDILKRSHGLLGESNATVATILNKYHRYVPEKLSPQLA